MEEQNTTVKWGTGFRSKTAGKLVLLLSGDDGMVQTALLTPMLASIMVEFPGHDTLQYDQMVSVTAVMMCLTMFLSSFLAKRINRKWLIIFGTACFALAGLSCSLAASLEFLTAARAVLGFGAGMALPLVPSAIAQLFAEKEKNQMLGWLNATGSVLSFTLSTLAGFIAVINWRSAFYLYLIFIPVIILQVLCLPNFKPEGQASTSSEPKEKTPLGVKPWLVAGSMLIVMALITVILYKLSPIIEFRGMGDASISGLSTSVLTASSFVAAVFFGNYFTKLKDFSPAASLLIGGLAFAFLGLASNIGMIFAGCVCCGIALGSLNPYFMSAMSDVAPANKMSFAMTLICVCQIGAQIVTPYYIAALSIIGIVDDQATCVVTAVILAAIAIAYLIRAIRKRAARQ